MVQQHPTSTATAQAGAALLNSQGPMALLSWTRKPLLTRTLPASSIQGTLRATVSYVVLGERGAGGQVCSTGVVGVTPANTRKCGRKTAMSDASLCSGIGLYYLCTYLLHAPEDELAFRLTQPLQYCSILWLGLDYRLETPQHFFDSLNELSLATIAVRYRRDYTLRRWSRSGDRLSMGLFAV